MKRITLAAIAALVTLAPLAAQQAPPAAAPAETKTAAPDPKAAASYVGKWTMDVQSPQGAAQIALEVKIDAANKVTGSTASQFGNSQIAGEFKDAKLGFSISVDAGGQALEVYFEGTLKGEKLEGQAWVGDQGFPWSATRVKS